jgi:hypothetical protein
MQKENKLKKLKQFTTFEICECLYNVCLTTNLPISQSQLLLSQKEILVVDYKTLLGLIKVFDL